MKYIEKLAGVLRSTALKEVIIWNRVIKRKMAGACLLTAFRVIVSLVLTIVTKELIDSATGGNRDAVTNYGCILAGLVIAERLTSMTIAHLRIKATADFQMRMQERVISSILSGTYTDFKRYHSGEIVNRVFSDVNVVKSAVTELPITIVSMCISFAGAAGILITMDARFVVLLVAGGIIGLAITIAFRSPLKKRHARMQEAEGRLHSSTQETIENLRIIKAGMSEKRAMLRMDGDRRQLHSEQIRRGRFSNIMNNSFGFVFDISWLVCMIWGCVNISNGFMTYGALAALIQLIGRIQGPIANAAGVAGQAFAMIASAERLKELTDVPAEQENGCPDSFEAVRFNDVSFKYADGADYVLEGLSCEIRKGDIVALTGVSGEGKTTFLQLILGIYSPSIGSVAFTDGKGEIKASRSTRALFSYVPQGNMLFSGTLRENLTFFNHDAADDEIMKAAAAACIDGLIAEIGLDAVLGERGIGLSEGQGQRVAVARALLCRAPILLLDESTSALDEDTEAEMLKNISEMRDKTVIIVTHRKAALDYCNRVLRMERGTIQS